MKKIIHVFLILTCYATVTLAVCSSQFSCGGCAEYKDCYWCSSSGKCEEYYGEKFANIICPNKWVQHDSLCPVNAGGSQGESELLSLLAKVKQNNSPSLESLLGAGSPRQNSGGTSSQELKDLLHKLLLLKLLRKIKAQGTGSLTAQETSLLSKLSSFHQQQVASTTTTTTTKAPDMTNEIKKLLSLLQNHSSTGGGEGETNVPPTQVPTPTNNKNTNSSAGISPRNITTTAVKVKPTAPTDNNATTESILSLLKKIDEQNAGVEYHENKPASLGKPDDSAKSKAVAAASTTALPSKTTRAKTSPSVNFCKLYEETILCNSDHNCTWCNTRDVCIGRSGLDYKGCVDAKDGMKDKEFGENLSYVFLRQIRSTSR